VNRQHDVEKHDRRPAAVQIASAYRGRPVLRAHRLRQPGGEAEQLNGERRES
jgi:hypothetical protein